jgi:hypothetical protein
LADVFRVLNNAKVPKRIKGRTEAVNGNGGLIIHVGAMFD